MSNMKMPMKFSAFLHYSKTFHKRFSHWILLSFFVFKYISVLEISHQTLQKRIDLSINIEQDRLLLNYNKYWIKAKKNRKLSTWMSDYYYNHLFAVWFFGGYWLFCYLSLEPLFKSKKNFFYKFSNYFFRFLEINHHKLTQTKYIRYSFLFLSSQSRINRRSTWAQTLNAFASITSFQF